MWVVSSIFYSTCPDDRWSTEVDGPTAPIGDATAGVTVAVERPGVEVEVLLGLLWLVAAM